MENENKELNKKLCNMEANKYDIVSYICLCVFYNWAYLR